ncbi:DUF6414 family protein [Rhodococcus ruber]|uniref:DUF6414 family protein n=1 Tax=Rhodococcus ruber TaxID=1830 RepID=UPI001267CABF|nr:hypothetical protein [Rhodococcus ruber]
MTSDTSAPFGPHVIVYQNADFIGGLLQAVLNDGLARTGETEFVSGGDHSTSRESRGDGGAQLKGGVPGIGEGALSLGGGGSRTTTETQNQGNTQRYQLSYDSALYLHRLQAALGESIQNISNAVEPSEVQPGRLVTFTGRFQPDPLSTLLDLATPELVAQVAHFIAKKSSPIDFNSDNWNLERVQAQWAEIDREAERRSALARTIAETLRTDFRRSSTLEFHCSIDDTLTAVVTCDAGNFVSEDTDRLLDGQFTVLGKVITTVEEDAPILRKNKFLRRLDTEWVQTLFDGLVDRMENAAHTVADVAVDDEQAPPTIDLDFPAVIEGSSFAVLPIAIYV